MQKKKGSWTKRRKLIQKHKSHKAEKKKVKHNREEAVRGIKR